MVKHIEKRRRVYYAMLNIPAAVRPAFNNKRQLLKSLETESISQAQVRVLPIIADWKNQIEIAKGTSTGDKFLDDVSLARRQAQRLRSKGFPEWEIQAAKEEVAINEALGPNNAYNNGDDCQLLGSVSVVSGKRLMMSEHIDSYLKTKSVTPKIKEMIRRDLVRFTSKFRFVYDATQRAVRHWANIDLEEANLALATRRRMLSACRGYWDYLERHQKLEVPPPFHKALPPKPKKRPKAEIEAKRKGFATQLENAGQPPNVVARLMGHTQDNQSFGNYSDGLVLEELKRTINHVDWSLH